MPTSSASLCYLNKLFDFAIVMCYIKASHGHYYTHSLSPPVKTRVVRLPPPLNLHGGRKERSRDLEEKGERVGTENLVGIPWTCSWDSLCHNPGTNMGRGQSVGRCIHRSWSLRQCSEVMLDAYQKHFKAELSPSHKFNYTRCGKLSFALKAAENHSIPPFIIAIKPF